MAWFGRKKPPELERVDAARKAIEKQGDPRPVIVHTLDKVEAAIEIALDDRNRVAESAAAFDAGHIADELKAALRTKPAPDAPDTDHIVALRRRHEAVHALLNRHDEIGKGIDKALADLETLVAQSAMAQVSSRDTFEDLRHWLDLLDADAQALTAAHDTLDRLDEIS